MNATARQIRTGPASTGGRISRRTAIVLGAAAATGAAGLTASAPSWAQPAQQAGAPHMGDDFWAPTRRLRLLHASGDTIDQVYVHDGQIYLPGYEAICYFLADRVARRAVTIDVRLLDILYGVNGWLSYFKVASSFVATSGYRDPNRNARIEGAALNSRHLTGEAIDGYIPGVSARMLAEFARWLGAGGVGWYPQRGFVHVDTGRVRSWRG